jgi:MoaA/NifB/PqqE/SkfB family radical SAM enzyme
LKGVDLGYCEAGYYHAAIDSNGDVRPCIDQEPVGNLLHGSLDAILSLRPTSTLQECSKNTPCFYGCTYGKRYLAENRGEIFVTTKYSR